VLADLRERRISVVRQPAVFDAVVPPDRRRHWSLPGGLPSSAALEERKSQHVLRVLDTGDFAAELADYLLRAEAVLLDVSGCVGCACAGVIDVHRNRATREAVMALEPPRATTPVIDVDASIVLDAPLPHLVDLSVRIAPVVGSPKPSVPARGPSPAPARSIADAASVRRTQERHRIAVTPPGIGSIPVVVEGRPADAAITAPPSPPPAVRPPPAPSPPVFAADPLSKPSIEPTPMANHHPRPTSESGASGVADQVPTVQVRRRTPAHALHLAARGSASTRVSLRDGAVLPRAYAAVRHRTPAAMPALSDVPVEPGEPTASPAREGLSPLPAADAAEAVVEPAQAGRVAAADTPSLSTMEAPLLPVDQPAPAKPSAAGAAQAPPPRIEMAAPITTVLEPPVSGPITGTPRRTPRGETPRVPTPAIPSTRRTLWGLLWWSVAIVALSVVLFLLYGAA
jgi:hypothetical protein